ncbi:type VI secretion system protein TssA [Pseudomonas sp. GD04087]|uniref:type VI secretion system protein TssA n=1 Tax=Pseudomonas TaxID=286 RepID=UPI001F2B829B|nr:MULTISPECIES: type VI secretion system protein TssA [Pseudomonas]MDH0292026.1 type VI secretion system protein TssA [Pseudomonas sp. GD04087]MDH1052632.1 type VI secretion system protein TssA [Pseudomonas sp. GD03903]MDH2003636.1 type VI secretion system protein TssA [Pseudomonas sp. GD03691]
MITDEAYQALLQAFPGDEICGASMRHDPMLDRLRELRREDDLSLPAGVWQAEPKRADWRAVEVLAQDVLALRSKDLMVAAYLGEAWILLDGAAGLATALRLLADLGESFAERLHPQAADGDLAWQAAPLVWVSRRYVELLATRLPLSPAWPELTLSAWNGLQRKQVLASENKADKALAEAARLEQKRLDESIRSGTGAGWGATLAQFQSALLHLQRLQAWCERQLQDEAPSLQPLASSIQSIVSILQGFRNMAPQEQETIAPVNPEPVVDAAASAAPAQPVNAENVLRDREQAYRQLAAIADFLARTEPHSPVPYVIRRAVEWGGMPLSALLDELVNADAEARRVWVMLGVLR